MMTINPAVSAVERTRQAAATALFVVTGFKGQASQTTALYCDNEDEARHLVSLFLDCGFLAASFAPNASRLETL